VSRVLHRLSVKSVERASKPGYHCDGGGLYLQVSPTASKSWIFRYTRQARSREMGLGSARDVSLAEARVKASDARRQLVNGIDPLAVREGDRAQERLAKAGTTSFAECAKKFIAAQRAAWQNGKHAEQWQNTLDTYAGPVIGELAVRDVDTAHVLRVLEPIWSKKPETASRLRGRIERILDYARVRGYRSGGNPARWRGHLDKLLPSALNRKTRGHHKALPYDELPAFMQELREQAGNAARALEYLILTAARTGEVIGCELDNEIDLKKAVWTVPAGRMKAGKEHRVPLSPQTVKVAESQPEGKHLFAGGREGAPLSNMAMLELLKRMGREGLTVHGFRSRFRDWAAESTSYPGEV
jgi:integrase